TSNLDTYGMATATLPEGAMFAEEVVPAVRHGSWAPMQAPRAPWGHLRHQPIPKTAEGRLAELEARLVAAAPQGCHFTVKQRPPVHCGPGAVVVAASYLAPAGSGSAACANGLAIASNQSMNSFTVPICLTRW